MTKNEIKSILNSRKGYYNEGRLKKGTKYLASLFNVKQEVIVSIVNELRKNKEVVKTKEVKNKYDFKNLPKLSKPVLTSVSDRSFSSNNNRITKPGTYFVTGCTHAPFHNKRMYESAFNYLSKETELEGVILAGDIIDANSLSFHDKGNVAIPGVSLGWEYAESRKFLNELDDSIKSANKSGNLNKIFLYGNHEDRYNRLIRQNDSSKYGEALISPEEGLDLLKRGYNVLKDWKSDVIHFGNHLDINHGEFCNVHTAKKTIDTYRKSTLYFHTHRFQIYMEGMNAGFNLGWGGDINSPVVSYATRAMKNSWVNACATITLDNNGFYHVQPLLFIKDKLIVNGKSY